MASRPITNLALPGAVEAAVEDLVRVRHWGGVTYVNLPLILPGGSFATVRVMLAAGGYRVDDGGFAYRELESIGAQRSFTKTALAIAEREGLQVNRRAFFVEATRDELGRAICDVAAASHAVAEQVYRKAADYDEGEIEDYLQTRLEHIFGATKLDGARTIKGSSSNEWEVSAILHVNAHVAVFQAVSPHANSVYRASTAFHDLAELPNPPRLVAVVKDLKALGPKLTLLSQAGRVIQSDQTDEVYERAAA